MADTMTCPITGKEIGEGQGELVMSSKGNFWIVHPDAHADKRRLDPYSNPETLKGKRPVGGPDAHIPNEPI